MICDDKQNLQSPAIELAQRIKGGVRRPWKVNAEKSFKKGNKLKTLRKVSSLFNILGVRRSGEINAEVQVRSLNRRLSVAGAFFKL